MKRLGVIPKHFVGKPRWWPEHKKSSTSFASAVGAAKHVKKVLESCLEKREPKATIRCELMLDVDLSEGAEC